MEYEIRVNDAYIELMHRAVNHYIKFWPGGDPEEQQALLHLRDQLDRLKLDVLFDTM